MLAASAFLPMFSYSRHCPTTPPEPSRSPVISTLSQPHDGLPASFLSILDPCDPFTFMFLNIKCQSPVQASSSEPNWSLYSYSQLNSQSGRWSQIMSCPFHESHSENAEGNLPLPSPTLLRSPLASPPVCQTPVYPRHLQTLPTAWKAIPASLPRLQQDRLHISSTYANRTSMKPKP